MYEYGLIGNCQISGLISKAGSIDWMCFPDPDSPPIFGGILDPQGGSWRMVPSSTFQTRQEYVPHTNILSTIFTLSDGSEFRCIDFAPRYKEGQKYFRPSAMIRKIEAIRGKPRLRMLINPVAGWSKTELKPAPISQSEIRWQDSNSFLCLQTNLDSEIILSGREFEVDQPYYFSLQHNSSFSGPLKSTLESCLIQTQQYWEEWIAGCTLPSQFREQTIRSALTLKLHCFEKTGAILAALTTSLPEEVGGTRNWDYRFCWIRDAYFVLSAFQKLGQVDEIGQYLQYLQTITRDLNLEKDGLRPLFTIHHQQPEAEMTHENWSGYRNSRPVRTRNQASEHTQNDAYGQAILSLSPVFLDPRFEKYRSAESELLMARLIRLCSVHLSEPDAGLWEIRGGWREHSFSNLLCWAGLIEGLKIQEAGFLKKIDLNLKDASNKALKAVANGVFEGVMQNGPTDKTLDASLLLLPVFGYPDASVNLATTIAIQKTLQISQAPESAGFLYRYLREDDFGKPQSAFLICGFWLVQAFALLNQKEKAIETLKNLLSSANFLGLFSEHYDPYHQIQSGNFPQAYSHVGLINSAFAISQGDR